MVYFSLTLHKISNEINFSIAAQTDYLLAINGLFFSLCYGIGWGLTRLTHSGLSITDWSFMGSVPPLNDEMWKVRFEKYQLSPEFRKVNSTMSLQEFKPIFYGNTFTE